MRFKGIFIVGTISLLFLVGFAAGCGGSDQSGDQQGGGGKTVDNQSQQSTSSGSGGGTGQDGASAQRSKIAVGKIVNVNTEAERLVVKPAKGENMVFKAAPKAGIKLDGKEAKFADIRQGQQVQLKYTLRDKTGVPSRALSITLFSNDAGGGTG